MKKELLNKILVYKQIKQRQNSIYNNDIFFASEIKKLFDKNLDKKEKKRIQKIIVSFDKKIKNLLELNEKSNVLVMGCEGNADTTLYNKLLSQGLKKI